MKGTGAETSKPMIDQRTSQEICNAVGERLQRDLRSQSFSSSPHLERLLEELRKLDNSRDLP
jgi:hypothetical protein